MQDIQLAGSRELRSIEQGLSGTPTGINKAFTVIAHSSSVSPSMLAGGIWEALITTAAGLLVAIPIHIGHHY